MHIMSSARVPLKCGDVDARAIVPIKDEIGGVVIYAGGRPAYYVLHGEWFEALPEPGSPRPGVRVAASDEANAAAEVDPAAVLRVF